MMVRQRKAFSLITAIFLILIMTSVSMFVISLSGKIVQSTGVQYQREQAMLLAKSYTEFAIMTVMSNDRNGTGFCIDQINSDTIIANTASIVPPGAPNGAQGFRARVEISYIGPNGEINNCTTQLGNPPLSNTLNIIVDTYIDYRDISDPRPVNQIPWTTYHRRTLQKI